MNEAEDKTASALRAKMRLIAILDSAEQAGIYPVRILVMHTLAYLCDALAAVWNLPILDSQVLKRRELPYFPRLQSDLDSLVGQGVVLASDVSYEREGRTWRLEASFALRRVTSDPILSAARQFPSAAFELDFAREVVYAASGLGLEGLSHLGRLDAAYSDPEVDIGGMVEIGGARANADLNASARAALRLRALAYDEVDLSDAELVHLYVRHLYSRLNVA